MNENKSKKESRLCDLIFHNRHCLAFITIIVFLLMYGFTANATQTQTGTITDMDLLTYYGISQPVFFTRDGINSVVSDSSVLSYSVIPSTGATIDTGYYDGTRPDAFCFISSVNGNDVDWENGYHVFTIGSTVTTSVMIYDCQGPCYFAVAGTDTSVYSQYPFKYVMRYVNADGSYVQYEYDDAYNYSSDGLTTYYCGINSGDVFLTDMPLNVASTDSSTGFDRMRNYDVYSVENYTDFNYLLNGGFIVPDAPSHIIPEVESDARYHLTFRDNTYYSGNGLNQFWHNNNFTFTEYQINNPVYYRLKFSYRVEFANNLGVDDVYYYTPTDDVQLAYFLGQSNRLGTGSRIAVPLSSDWFKNGSNQSLTSAIISTINAVTGTDVQYINPNGLFENIIDWAVTVDNYVFGDGSGSPLQVVTNRYDGVITKFKVYGEVTLYNEVNSNYESYSYKDSHNFLTGNGQVISTDNTVAPYEDSPTPIYEELPSNGSNGGVSAGAGSAVATIQKGAIQIYTGASGQNGFQLSAQGWTDYGNFYQTTANALKDLATGEGDFPQVVQNAGSWLPSPIWALVLAGVGTSICIGLWHGVRNH